MKTKTLLSIILLGSFAVWTAIAGDEKRPACCAEKATAPTNSCCAQPAEPTATSFTDKSLYQIESVWTSDSGVKSKLGTLRGRPQVVAMFFASCQYTCPIIVNDMKRIQDALPADLRTNVGFTLVSFDSERDSPAALHQARVTRGLDANWNLFRGEPDDVRELAALLGVNYRKDASGQFVHSNLITILNADGEIIFQKAGLNAPAEEMAQKISALIVK